MALAKVTCKASSALLRWKKPVTVPTSCFQTSASCNAWYNIFWPYKTEYDEQGELGLPREIDLAVGHWKKELLVRAAGEEDPYGVLPIVRGDKGTKIDPILVPGAFESRVIGCWCEPEAHSTITMWLHQGEPKRCRCGFWFQLYYKPPFPDYSTICP